MEFLPKLPELKVKKRKKKDRHRHKERKKITTATSTPKKVDHKAKNFKNRGFDNVASFFKKYEAEIAERKSTVLGQGRLSLHQKPTQIETAGLFNHGKRSCKARKSHNLPKLSKARQEGNLYDLLTGPKNHRLRSDSFSDKKEHDLPEVSNNSFISASTVPSPNDFRPSSDEIKLPEKKAYITSYFSKIERKRAPSVDSNFFKHVSERDHSGRGNESKTSVRRESSETKASIPKPIFYEEIYENEQKDNSYEDHKPLDNNKVNEDFCLKDDILDKFDGELKSSNSFQSNFIQKRKSALKVECLNDKSKDLEDFDEFMRREKPKELL